MTSSVLAFAVMASLATLVLTAAGLDGTAALGPIRVTVHDYTKPLTWGVAAAGLFLVLERASRIRWRLSIAALALFGVLAILNYGRHAETIVTDSDGGVGELYVELATRGELLVGPYSRFGWHHPGPLYFYLTAPFYAWSGHQAAAIYAVAVAINLLALVVIAWVLMRERRELLLTTTLAACVFFAWRARRLLASPWTGHIAVLPAIAFVVVAAAVIGGRRRLLPLAIILGSFVAQTHVGFVPIVGALTAIAAIATVARSQSAGESPWTILNVAAWMGVALWLAPITEAVAHQGGNLASLWRFFVSERGDGHPLVDAIRNGSYGLAGMLRPDFDLAWGGHFDMVGVPLCVAGALVGFVALGLVMRAHARAGRNFDASLAAAAFAATGVGVLSLMRVRGDILTHDLFRLAALGALDVAVLTAAGLALVSRSLQTVYERGHIAVRAASGALLVMATALAVTHLQSLAEFERGQQAGGRIVKAYQAVRGYLDGGGFSKPLVRVGPDQWGLAAGLLLRLVQDGTPVAGASESLPMFTDRFRATGDEDATVTLANLEQHHALKAEANNTILLEAFPAFVDAAPGVSGRR